MTTLPVYSFNSEVYVAFKLQESSVTGGWMPSGRGFSDSSVQTDSSLAATTTNTFGNQTAKLPISTDTNYTNIAPTSTNAYSIARSFEVSVKQDYPVPGSTGGPQPAGRPDFDVAVFTRDCDQISPYLFQYAASGWVIDQIYVIRYISLPEDHDFLCHEWSLSGGLVVAGYQFSHGRYYNECLDRTSLSSRETVKIVYTDIQYRCSKISTTAGAFTDNLGAWKGWKTGSEEIIN